MRRALITAVAGGLTGGGLVIAGMTQPSRVIGFLDVTGAWDPTGLLVMAAAMAIFAVAFWTSPRPPLAKGNTRIDGRLIAGAALFGVGWGASGLCPGPALVAAPTSHVGVLLFLLSMVLAMTLARRFWPAPRLATAKAAPRC